MRRRLLLCAILFACGAPPRADAPDSSGSVLLTIQLHDDGLGIATAAGLPCLGITCTGRYPKGAAVQVNAASEPGSLFGGWTGACAGASSCTLSMHADLSATATFLLAQKPLTLRMRLDGGGTARVVSDPPGLDCASGTCVAPFARDTAVTLTATPGSARFVRWTGNCPGTASTCKVVIGSDNEVGADFLGANYVFATSTTLSESGLTLAQADGECAARAAAARLPGSYLAWLSTSKVDARSRLGSAQRAAGSASTGCPLPTPSPT